MSERERLGFERMLAAHTAPTLLGIKCANLVSVAVSYGQLDAFREEFERRSGLRMRILCCCRERVLVYVYHELLLGMQLSRPEIRAFLTQYGYTPEMNAEEMLTHLAERMACSGFPHEIGIFLGYPLADVKGFIRHRGRNCLLCGCWKVYSDPEKARQTFANYDRCRTILCDKLDQGFDLFQALSLSKEELS